VSTEIVKHDKTMADVTLNFGSPGDLTDDV